MVATPPAVMAISPLTVPKTELEINGRNEPESTENVLAAAPSNVPAASKPAPAVRALGTYKTDNVFDETSIVVVSATFVLSIVPSTEVALMVIAPLDPMEASPASDALLNT